MGIAVRVRRFQQNLKTVGFCGDEENIISIWRVLVDLRKRTRRNKMRKKSYFHWHRIDIGLHLLQQGSMSNLFVFQENSSDRKAGVVVISEGLSWFASGLSSRLSQYNCYKPNGGYERLVTAGGCYQQPCQLISVKRHMTFGRQMQYFKLHAQRITIASLLPRSYIWLIKSSNPMKPKYSKPFFISTQLTLQSTQNDQSHLFFLVFLV